MGRESPGERRLGERDPRAPSAAAARTQAGGQTPSGGSSPGSDSPRETGKRAGFPQAPRCPADGVADQPRNHRSLASEARAVSGGLSCADGPQPERLDPRSPRGEGGHPNFHFSRPLPIHFCVLSACRALERSPCLSHLHEDVRTQRTQTHTHRSIYSSVASAGAHGQRGLAAAVTNPGLLSPR